MTVSSILVASLRHVYSFFCSFSLLGLTACDSATRLVRNNPTQLTALPDSAALRPYRRALAQLATTDQADRQTIFRVFRQHGFRSSQADTANRWLMRRDSLRLATFQVLERRYGWPRAKAVGAASVQQAYLLVQHAPDHVQASYQDTLRAAHARGELQSPDYATYLDRLWVNQGKPQRFGTQRGRRVLATGQEEEHLLPVEDLPHLDQHRASLQLEPLLPQLRPGTLILKFSSH
jgi:hypothetical protein